MVETLILAQVEKRAKVSLRESSKVSILFQMNERYEFLAPIAEGGLGTVFKARDRQSGREVAVKRAHATSAAALLEEARRQSAVNHPNIVSVIETGTDAEGAFIVMELVQGETLEARLGRGPLSSSEFDVLVRQTLAGVAATHAAGIIHLDLKPENLMLAAQPGGGMQVKILDFGLARELQPGAGQAEQPPLHGSIYFMAPEQFENAAADVRTDLYALGCVFYYALTHRHPFEGEMKPQVMVAHLHHRMTPLADLRPDLPKSTVRWIEHLTSRSPADRPASAAAALQEYLSLD